MGDRREPSLPAGILWHTVLGSDRHGILQQLDGGQGWHWVCKKRGRWATVRRGQGRTQMAAHWDFHSHLSVSRTSFQTLTAGSYHTLFPAALEPASSLRLAKGSQNQDTQKPAAVFLLDQLCTGTHSQASTPHSSQPWAWQLSPWQPETSHGRAEERSTQRGLASMWPSMRKPMNV